MNASHSSLSPPASEGTGYAEIAGDRSRWYEGGIASSLGHPLRVLIEIHFVAVLEAAAAGPSSCAATRSGRSPERWC